MGSVAFDGNLILSLRLFGGKDLGGLPGSPLSPLTLFHPNYHQQMKWGFICRDLQGRGVSGLPLGRPHQSVIKCLGSVGELQQRPAYQGGIYLLTVQIISHQIGLLFSPITGWRAEVTDHSIAYLTINRTWKKGVCCTQLIFGDSDGHQVDGKLLLIISTLLFSSLCSQRKAFT